MSKKTVSNKHPSPPDLEKQRSMMLHSKGFIYPFMVREELRQSSFFIETMESFISQSEKDEVDDLAIQTESMTDEEKSDFWSNNYPVHWDEVFGIRIRSAFCTQLCSQIEGTLSNVARNVQVLARAPLGIKDIKGANVLAQHRLYFETFGGFSGLSDVLWKEVGHMFLVRNAHVHEQGYFGKHKANKEFVAFLDTLPSVKKRGDFIELQAGSCPAFLDIAKRFQDALFDEYQDLRDRLVLLEPS